MKTTFLGIIAAAIIISGIIAVTVYSIQSAKETGAPIPVEFPNTDEIEIHCEIITPA